MEAATAWGINPVPFVLGYKQGENFKELLYTFPTACQVLFLFFTQKIGLTS